MKMPNEYKGKLLKSGGITINQPRKWTDEEIKWCLDLKEKGYSIKNIADSIDRDLLQVQIKIKRLSKNENT